MPKDKPYYYHYGKSDYENWSEAKEALGVSQGERNGLAWEMMKWLYIFVILVWLGADYAADRPFIPDFLIFVFVAPQVLIALYLVVKVELLIKLHLKTRKLRKKERYWYKENEAQTKTRMAAKQRLNEEA